VSERRAWFGTALLIVVLVGFGVRVAYVLFAKSERCTVTVSGKVVGTSPSECTTGDQIFYNAQANTVARGDGFVEPLWRGTHPGEDPPPAADHPPLTVFVLAPVSWLVEHPPIAWFVDEPLNDHVREHRYTMVVLGTFLVLLVGVLGRRLGGDAVGIIAASIVALSPNVWVNDGLIMSESVTTLTVVGALWAAFQLWDRPNVARAAVLGVLCGVAALARAELVVLIVLLGVVVAVTSVRARAKGGVLVLVAVATSLVVIGPWVAYNMTRFADRTFISTNDGIALLGSNCDTVYHGSALGLTAIAGERNCLDDPPPPGDQSEVATAYRKRAFEYVRDNKRRVPVVVAARIGRTWGLFRPNDMVAFNEGEGREKTVTRLGMVAYYPTLLAAIGGAVVLARRRAWRDLYVVLVPAIAVTAGVAISYGQTRFRAAAEPSLAILAAVALVAVVRTLRSRRASTATPRTDATDAVGP
jgi:type III secretory pathway component EscS